jgi:murein DD-endopeptidase MepM/ murein hydrolase activator NlpD
VRGLRSALFKALLFIGLLFVASHFNVAAANLLNYHDTDGVAGSASASPAFIPGISPIYDFYSYWDTANLDPYRFDFSKITGAINLQVLDADCGFALPVIGALSSPFGWRWGQVHAGVDLHLKTGDTVVSAFDGVVRMSKWYGGYGNCVVVRHHNGLETLYGHLSKRIVQPGDLVNAGQVIGLGGSTGYSTGPHLHFETRIMGKAFNPQMLIDFKKDSLLKDTLSFTATSFTAPAAPVYRYYYRGYRKPYYYRRRR